MGSIDIPEIKSIPARSVALKAALRWQWPAKLTIDKYDRFKVTIPALEITVWGRTYEEVWSKCSVERKKIIRLAYEQNLTLPKPIGYE